jgi:hypothetical protein
VALNGGSWWLSRGDSQWCGSLFMKGMNNMTVINEKLSIENKHQQKKKKKRIENGRKPQFGFKI